ncbi:MAG TPA: hypothetical protein VJ775_06225 [Sphingomicrobium sp.]|nr:hypothetical protein [Sphingomicrobium sp.]
MPTFEVSAKPPSEDRRSARIFRLARPDISRKSLLSIAGRLGLRSGKGGTLSRDARQFSYSEGSRELMLHRASGGWRFIDKARWQVDDGSNVEFDDSAATAIARRHIEAFALVPLAECELLRVTRLNVCVVQNGSRRIEHRRIDAGVAFSRLVDGIPVEGPGGKCIVYLDSERELTAIDRLWREISGDRPEEVPLRPVNAVLDEAKREWAVGGSGTVRVDDIRFGYFEQAWDTSQRYLQPAYVLSLQIADRNSHFPNGIRAEYWGAACVTSPERLVPRRRAGPKQPRRTVTRGL